MYYEHDDSKYLLQEIFADSLEIKACIDYKDIRFTDSGQLKQRRRLKWRASTEIIDYPRAEQTWMEPHAITASLVAVTVYLVER